MRDAMTLASDGAEMDVLFVTSMFPRPSEAFAGVEVRALEDAGARLRIRALRPRHPLARQLLEQLHLTRSDVSHLDLASFSRGLAFVFVHPVMAVYSVAWLLRYGWRTPGPTFRCLVLMPRLFDIFAECLRCPPDVLCLYWGHYPAIVGYLAKRYLQQVHLSMGFIAYDLVYEFTPGLRMADQADSLWTIADCNAAKMRELGVTNPRLRVLVHGVDLSEIPDVSRLHTKRPGLIVTISRLVKNKGVDDALRVLARARRLDSSLSLAIIGEGEEKANLEALARELGVMDIVRFLGPLAHAAVYEHLAAADMLLLMSRNPSERLPNVVKEAMACRCICVITESPGIEELTCELANKLVVKQGDYKLAADLVIRVMRNRASFEGDRDMGREYILGAFDASRMAREKMAAWTASRISTESQRS